MGRSFYRIIIPICFIATALVVVYLLFFPNPFGASSSNGTRQTRFITPNTATANSVTSTDGTAEYMAYEDQTVSKVLLGEGDVVISVLTQDLDGDPQEEQVIAYRNTQDDEAIIRLTYVDFDDISGLYLRVWSDKTRITKSGTLSLYVKDLLGDRSVCVLASGLNEAGEQILTVYRKNETGGLYTIPFARILELRVDGSIVIHEKERSQAYQLGLSEGESFLISTYERDMESNNLLDQIEVYYTYDIVNGEYKPTSTTRIEGAQMEQRRVRELLDGTPGKFELFLQGLWYYTGSDVPPEERRYIYFDPIKREMIFYADDTQEVFLWQSSSATRYGIYITSQNISVTTLRRLVDIELESVDSIRIKMFEDVKLKIGVTGKWDGSYRKVVNLETMRPTQEEDFTSWIDAEYEGPLGKLQFSGNGTFLLQGSDIRRSGRYTFFMMNNFELLELRYEDPDQREVYRVERDTQQGAGLILTKVRLGVRGLVDLHEGSISMYPVTQEGE